MHDAFLNSYRHELHFLREVGEEFAKAYPRMAGALAPTAKGASDPFVERLLEGIAFLTAKTVCRMDSEYQRLAYDLIQSTMPDLLCPLPPGAIVELKPLSLLTPSKKAILPRGSNLRHRSHLGDLVYRSIDDVDLAPLRIETLQPPSETQLYRMLEAASRKGKPLGDFARCRVLRVELASLSGQPLAKCMPDNLRLYCSGLNGMPLWTALTQQTRALLLINEDAGGLLHGVHSQHRLSASGLSEDESLLPNESIVSGPYRLLREWLHWPNRFAFARLHDLLDGLRHYDGSRIELWWLFDADSTLPHNLETDSLRLFCTPVVNLRLGQCDPITLRPTETEYFLQASSHLADSHDIALVDKVEWRNSDGLWQKLSPIQHGFDPDDERHMPSYVVRQHPRWHYSDKDDRSEARFEWRIAAGVTSSNSDRFPEIISVSAWMTHRRAGAIPGDDQKGWRMDCVAPVTAVVGVGHPISASQTQVSAHSLLAGAAFRFDSLQQRTPEARAAALRQCLGGIVGDDMLSGIESIHMQHGSRRIPWSKRLMHAPGWILVLDIDRELAEHSHLSSWFQILVATLAWQLGAEAFIEARCDYDGRTYAQSLVWR